MASYASDVVAHDDHMILSKIFSMRDGKRTYWSQVGERGSEREECEREVREMSDRAQASDRASKTKRERQRERVT